MGTEVEIKSNLTAFPSMRDHNEDSNGCSWAVMYGDKALQNGFYQNGLLPRAAADAYLGYDKDSLKQTMLEHEAIFRSQVCELHRLYGIQRVLMDGIKKESQGNRGPNEASGSVLSQTTCEGSRKWQITNGPRTSPGHMRPSTSEIIHSPISSAKGEFFLASNGGSLNTSESRPSKVRRKMFDLHLPAEEYLDADEHDSPRDNNLQSVFSNRDQDRKVETENGVNPFLGKKEIDGKFRNMADMNEPISVKNTSPFSNGESVRSKPPFAGLTRESSLNSHLHGSGDIRNKTSASQDVWLNSMPQQQNRALFSKNQETLLYGKQKIAVSRDKSFYSFGVSESLKSPESVLLPQLPSHLPITSSVDFSKSSWPQAPSFWEKSGNIHMQKALPIQMNQFEASQRAAQSYGILSDKWQEENAVSSSSGFGELPNKQNGFYRGSSSGCKELSGSNNFSSLNYDCFRSRNDGEVNLNAIPLIDPRDPISTHGFRIANGERKQREDNAVTLPWLRAVPADKSEIVVIDELDSRDPKLLDSFHWFANKTEAGKSGACSIEVDLNRVGTSEFSSDRKLFGRSFFDTRKNEPSSITSVSHQSEGKEDNTRKVRLLDINLPCDPIPESTQEHNSAGTLNVEKKGSEQGSPCSRHQMIDLNLCLSEDETCVFPRAVNADRKQIPVIDLEIPAVPDEEDIFAGHVLEQLCETSLQKHEEIIDDLCKAAAEAIVSISSADDTVRDLAESKGDPLNWFVDTILSCGGSDEIRPRAGSFRDRSGGSNGCESTSEEVDYFEMMTLQLMETKPEDYLPDPFLPESFDVVDEPAAVAPAPGRPRRGQARRGRQRRDFQRDILPGLASLSRHEVTEDLQTFGGLMRATGYHTWQSGLTRRNSTRNGSRRGRRRATETVSVSPSSGSGSPVPTLPPLIQQVSNVGTGGFEERQSLTGWGKTTRRPRRQRCHAAGNPLVIHIT